MALPRRRDLDRPHGLLRDLLVAVVLHGRRAHELALRLRHELAQRAAVEAQRPVELGELLARVKVGLGLSLGLGLGLGSGLGLGLGLGINRCVPLLQRT